jgi:choline kinase
LLVNMSKNRADLSHVDGELVGISKISSEMYAKMVEVAGKMFEQSLKVEYEHCIVRVAQVIEVSVPKIDDLVWAEIDDPSHMKRVLEVVAPRINQ